MPNFPPPPPPPPRPKFSNGHAHVNTVGGAASSNGERPLFPAPPRRPTFAAPPSSGNAQLQQAPPPAPAQPTMQPLNGRMKPPGLPPSAMSQPPYQQQHQAYPPPPPSQPSYGTNQNQHLQHQPPSYPQQNQHRPQYQQHSPSPPPTASYLPTSASPQPPYASSGLAPPPPPNMPFQQQQPQQQQYPAPPSSRPGPYPPQPPGTYSQQQQHQQQQYGSYPPPPPSTINQDASSYRPAPPPPPVGQGSASYGASRPPPPQQQTMDRGGGGAPKISPDQVPRPPRPFDSNQDSAASQYYYYTPRASIGSIPPAPTDDSAISRDDGNACPHLLRSTVYDMPSDRGIWHKTGDIPLGVICMPMATVGAQKKRGSSRLPDGTLLERSLPDTTDIPVESALEPTPPIRCASCLAYPSPFSDGQCSLCGRRDVKLVPTSTGTVEYRVNGPYLTRSTPVEPAFVYAIDLTLSNVREVVEILKQVVLSRNPATAAGIRRVGLCFVGSQGVVVRDNDTQRYCIMPHVVDQADIYCHLPLQSWTFDANTEAGLAAWCDFCDSWIREDDDESPLQTWRKWAKQRNAAGLDGLELSCGGTALQFLAAALAETGGRGTWIASKRPNYGVGKLPLRNSSSSTSSSSSDKKKKSGNAGTSAVALPLLEENILAGEQVEAAQFYRGLAKECATNRVALDVVLRTSPTDLVPYLDVATLSWLCRATCGELRWIRASHDSNSVLQEELTRPWLAVCGWDAVLKVRCSSGLQVKSYRGNVGAVVEGGMMGSSELELACVTPSTAITVELEHRVGGIPKDQPYAYIQSALLYTCSETGERRVRVSTLAVHVTQVPNECYKATDIYAVTTFLGRETVERMFKPQSNDSEETARKRTREALFQRVFFMLASYRQHTPAKSCPPGQLLLPEKLQWLPLWCMALIKRLLRVRLPRRIVGGGMEQEVALTPTADEVAYCCDRVLLMRPSNSLSLVYPAVYSLWSSTSSLQEGVGQYQRGPAGETSEVGFVVMPPVLFPRMDSLQEDGVFLIDNGLCIYLYVGKSVPMETKRVVDQWRDAEHDVAETIRNVVWQLRAGASRQCGSESDHRATVPPVLVVHQKEAVQSLMEAELWSLMVDDAAPQEQDYVDFLCNLHNGIKQRMEGTK